MICTSRIMKSPTAQIDFYARLLDHLIRDIHSGTATGKGPLRDAETASRRVSNEGLYFLTIALPSLGKALDLALETKRFFTPVHFGVQKGTNLPKFLFDKFNLVFDRSGCLLDQPDALSIQELRQVTYVFYKLELSFNEFQTKDSLDKFRQAENDLRGHSFGQCDAGVIRRAQALLENLFHGYDPRDIFPGHGPGSVNTGEKGNEKWAFKRLYLNAHQCYPWYEYFVSSYRDEILDRVTWYKGLEKRDHSRSKVVLVPKDSRGPRVISVEPLEMQYLQQGQMKSLVKWIERHPLTRGRVNFTDQTVNQRLALSSSVDRKFATLDLKEASDRVHVNLVRLLFPEELTRFLFATRSSGTVLPCGEYLEFRKFAPMGSATCFPVLALTLWALCRAYLDVNRVHDPIYVYGDDVIVPTHWARDIGAMLESFALRVNSSKSFVEGSFRESCGVDAYSGIDVTPIRVSKPWSGKSTDYGAYSHFVSFMERMFLRGYWNTYGFVKQQCEALYGLIPYGTPTSGFPCHMVPDPSLAEELNTRQFRRRVRVDSDFQRKEFKVLSYSERTSCSDLEGWPRLLKGLVSPSRSDPTVVVFRQVRKLAWRWMAV